LIWSAAKSNLLVGQVGNSPQFAPPHSRGSITRGRVLPASDHPIVKNLDRVDLRFCSSIDTIRTKTPVKKTPVLTTSRYSRLQFSPIDLNFEILKYQPDPGEI
jgi:hypothetical protein